MSNRHFSIGGLGALGLILALAGCEKEVRLEGERFPIRTPLEASLPVEGAALPVAPAEAENRSVPISLPGMQANAEWPQRGANPQHQPPHGKLSAAPALALVIDGGAGNNRKARAANAPVIAGNRLFVMDTASDVRAFSLGGEALWTASVRAEFDAGGGASAGGLAVAGGTVFASTGYGEVVALDAGSGAVRWRQRFDSPISSAPTVEGGTVYISARDGSVAAISAESGKLIWQDQATPGRRTLVGSAAPAISGGLVLFPMASGELVAYDRAEGKGVWRGAATGQNITLAAAQAHDFTGDPVVSGGQIFAGTQGGRTIALSAEDGRRLWSANEGAVSAPLVVGGSLFQITEENRIIRLDAASGEVIWAMDMPYFTKDKAKRRKAIHAQFGPVLAGGRLAVAGADGSLRMFDPASGAITAQAEIPSGAAAAPVLAQGMLFVLAQNGKIYAFR